MADRGGKRAGAGRKPRGYHKSHFVTDRKNPFPQVSVRIPREAYDALQRVAEEDDLSPSAWMEGVIIEELKKRGKL